MICGGVIAGLCLYFNLWRAWKSNAVEPLRALEIEDRAGDLPSYLVTFLLPFALVVDPSRRDLIALGVFGIVLLYVSLQSNTVVVNPWIYLAGLRLYGAKLDRGNGKTDQALLLARRRPSTMCAGKPPSPDDPGDRAVLIAASIYLIWR